MYPIVSRQFEYISPPRAGQLATPGSVGAITVSATAGAIDLRQFMPQTYNSSDARTTSTTGAVDSYLTIQADGADLGIIVGAALADVTGGNAPALATVGAVTANVYPVAGVAGCCLRIPTGTSVRLKLDRNRDNFLGYVASAAGTMRLYQSSPPREGV